MTAFSGTCLADFAEVARTQVLFSHTLPHSEHEIDVIEEAGAAENRGGVRGKVAGGQKVSSRIY